MGDQVRAFARASHALGAEGAGLSNVIYLAGSESEVGLAANGDHVTGKKNLQQCSVVSFVPGSFECGVSYIWHLTLSLVSCEFEGFRVKGWETLEDGKGLRIDIKVLKEFLAEFWGTFTAKVKVPLPSTSEL